MKKLSAAVFGILGLLYGLTAVFLVYRDVPIGLQAFIVLGVVTTAGLVGWLVGVGADLFRRNHARVTNRPDEQATIAW